MARGSCCQPTGVRSYPLSATRGPSSRPLLHAGGLQRSPGPPHRVSRQAHGTSTGLGDLLRRYGQNRSHSETEGLAEQGAWSMSIGASVTVLHSGHLVPLSSVSPRPWVTTPTCPNHDDAHGVSSKLSASYVALGPAQDVSASWLQKHPSRRRLAKSTTQIRTQTMSYMLSQVSRHRRR